MRFALTRAALLAATAIIAVVAVGPARPALAAGTIEVNSLGDGNTRDTVMTLREAIRLASGTLPLEDLTEEECAQVSAAQWSVSLTCVGLVFPNPPPPGAGSADTIIFSGALFVDSQPNHILLDGALNSLSSGSDSIIADGDAVNGASNVTIDGRGIHTCIPLHSGNNTVRGLSFVGCNYGVVVTGGSSNTIGGPDPSDRNTFSESETTAILVWAGSEGTMIQGNTFYDNPIGIDIGGQNTSGNVVADNYIGFDPLNPGSPGNNTGIEIDNAPGNIIGGSNTGIAGNAGNPGNVISGNISGVVIEGSTADGNVVAGNYIGTDITGSEPLGNGAVGVQIGFGASDNVIGGDFPSERNVIAATTNRGVNIFGTDSTGNQVLGNYIGTSASGEEALPNGSAGMELSDLTPGTLVQGNVLAANGELGPNGSGIRMFSANGVEIYDNRIGISPTGEPLGNDNFGIFMQDSSDNIIGDVNGGGNIIAFNGEDGIRVRTEAGQAQHNTIRGNSIFSHAGKGIENTDGGNEELAPPVITGFGSVSGTACDGCIIDVYSDDEDEGRVYEGTAVADGNGDWTLDGGLVGPNATATATDGAGNTSEFSAAEVVPDPATPTPTPAPELTQGDLNCDGVVDALDALALLLHLGDAPAEFGDCPPIGDDSGEFPFGDVNCDNVVDAADLEALLRHLGDLDVTQGQGCQEIGQTL